MKNETKKTLSLLLALVITFSPFATIPLSALAANYDVSSAAQLTAALTDAASSDTIRLTADINYTTQININSKKLTLDLNGYTLYVDTGSGNGLTVGSGGSILLANPANGAFNVNGSVFATGAGSRVQVNNTSLTAGGYGVSAVQTQSGAIIDVFGDVMFDGECYDEAYPCHAVLALGGGQINVEGDITVPDRPGVFSIGVQDGGDVMHPLPINVGSYFEYRSGNSVVRVKYAFEVGGVYTGDLNSALKCVENGANGQTVKLLKDHTHYGTVVIHAGHGRVIFNLNGYTLTINGGAGVGLHVEEGGGLSLVDPYQGELNVTGASGVNAEFVSVEVTNVTATSPTGFGVTVCEGDVTVHGSITSAGVYINLDSGPKALEDGTASSKKPGYLEFIGYDSVVWVKDPYICEITAAGAKYKSVTEAIAAVPVGESAPTTIKLLADINHNGPITVNNKKIEFDLNGKTLNIINPSTESGAYALLVNNNGEVTQGGSGAFNVSGLCGVRADSGGKATVTNVGGITYGAYANGSGSRIIVKGKILVTSAIGVGYGAIAISGGQLVADGDITVSTSVSAGYGVFVSSGGQATVNGDITVAVTSSVGACYGAYAENGQATVNGDIKVTAVAAAYGVYVGLSGGQVTVDGSITVPAGERYIAVGTTVKTKEQGVLSTTKPGYLEYIDGLGAVWVKSRYVCEIGGVLYESVTEAIDAVPSGGVAPTTIKLLTDIDQNSAVVVNNKKITFDLNGKTLNVINPSTISSSCALLVENYGEVNLTGAGALNVTGVCGVYAASGGKATVTNATGSRYGAFSTNAGSQVTVNGDIATTGNNSYSAISYGAYADSGGQVTVNGDVVGSGDYIHGAGAVSNGSKVTVNGDITIAGSEDRGVYANGGQVNITGDIKVTGSNGCGAYAGDGQVNVTGNITVLGKYGVFSNGNGQITATGNIAVTGGNASCYGVYTYDRDNRITVTGDILVTAESSYGYGAFAYDAINGSIGSQITVSGNITVSGGNSSCGAFAGACNQITVNGDIKTVMTGLYGSGVEVASYSYGGGLITINGVLTVPAGVTYITTGYMQKTKEQGVPSTAMPDYLEYTDGISTVLVLRYSCQSLTSGTKYENIATAVTAVPSGSSDIIRLLLNIDNNGAIAVNNKTITFDLNGKTLNINPSAVNTSALTVISGQVNLLDPSNGELNVAGTNYGILATGGAKVTVTGAESTGATGIYATDTGTDITVLNNVKVAGGGPGISASVGAKVTVGGELTVPTGAIYIRVGTTNKAPGDHTAVSSKIGYLEYTDGMSYVWVPEAPSQFAPIFNLQPKSQTISIGQTATFTVLAAGDPSPTYQWQQIIGGLWRNIRGETNPTLRIDGVTEGIMNYRCAAENDLGIAYSDEVTLTVTERIDDPIIYVSSATGRAGGEVTLTATMENNPGIASYTLTMKYPQELEFVSVQNGDILTANFMYTTTVPGQVSFGATSFNGADVSTGTVLFTITFKIKAGVEEMVIDETAGLNLGFHRAMMDLIEHDGKIIPCLFDQGRIIVRNIVYGDVNGDGYINAMDVTRLLRYIWEVDTSSNSFVAANADVNGDGYINAMDVTRLLRYIWEVDTSPLGPPIPPSAAPAAPSGQGPAPEAQSSALMPFNTDCDTSVSLSSASGAAGDEVTLTVSLDNNPGIASFSLSLEYPEELTFVEAAPGDIIGANFRAIPDDGRITIFATSQNGADVSEGDELFSVTFKIDEGAKAGVIDGLSLGLYRKGDLIESDEKILPIEFLQGAITVDDPDEGTAIVSVTVTAKDFIGIKETAKNSGIWVMTFKAEETYANGQTETVTYELDFKGNNANLDGIYTFGDEHALAGYSLVYDIKGNGSNIKDFKLIRS